MNFFWGHFSGQRGYEKLISHQLSALEQKKLWDSPFQSLYNSSLCIFWVLNLDIFLSSKVSNCSSTISIGYPSPTLPLSPLHSNARLPFLCHYGVHKCICVFVFAFCSYKDTTGSLQKLLSFCYQKTKPNGQ